MDLKHLWTAPTGDGSGDTVMAVRGDIVAIIEAAAAITFLRSG